MGSLGVILGKHLVDELSVFTSFKSSPRLHYKDSCLRCWCLPTVASGCSSLVRLPVSWRQDCDGVQWGGERGWQGWLTSTEPCYQLTAKAAAPPRSTPCPGRACSGHMCGCRVPGAPRRRHYCCHFTDKEAEAPRGLGAISEFLSTKGCETMIQISSFWL